MSEIDKFLDGDTPKPVTPATAAPQSPQIEDYLKDAPATARGLKGWGRDIAATAVKGAIAVPEALVGLADIPTGGRVGKFLENEGGAVGFRPKQAKEQVNEWHSDATKEAQRKFQEADGVWDKTVAAIQNPSNIAVAVGESLAPMGLGGVAARGLMAATKLGQMGTKGAVLAGAAGEGATMAGSQAEQIRQETNDGLLNPTQAGLAVATGLAGGAFGVAGGKVAQRLGIGDADTMLAQGIKGVDEQIAGTAARAAANPLVADAAVKSIPRKVIEGAISEGFLEELPQSMAEQIFQNVALGKDWFEELDSAAVMGVLSGGAMGAGAAGFRGFRESSANGDKDAAAGKGDKPLQLAYNPDPLVVFPDGTVGTQAQVDAYINGLPEGERIAARAALLNQGAQAADASAQPNKGLARVGQEFAMRLRALQEQEQGEPSVPQTTPPDGAAALAQQQAARNAELAQAQAERDALTSANRAIESPDDEILQSTGAAPRPSEAMGLRSGPAAGSLENAAALSVDTGASAQMQQAAAQAQAAEVAAKQSKAEPKKEAKQGAFEPGQQWVSKSGGSYTIESVSADGKMGLADFGNGEKAQVHFDAESANGWTLKSNQKQEQPAQDQQSVDPITGEISGIPSMADWSDVDLSTAFRNAQSKDVRRQLAEELSRRRALRTEAEQAASVQPEPKTTQAPAAQQQAQPAAPGSQADGANVATLAQLNRKKLAEMSVDELNQLASLLPGEHSRQQKIQKAIQDRTIKAQEAINEGAKKDGTQTSQTRQSSTQPAQAGAAQTVQPTEQGLTNAATPVNNGPQAAAPTGAQGQAPSETKEQRAQRVVDAGAAWARMPTAEREALANRTDVKPVLRKNLPRAKWDDLHGAIKSKLADAMAPQADDAPARFQGKHADKINPAIEAVREHVAGAIDKAALIGRLRPLGLTEAQVESVTYKLGDDFSMADVRAVNEEARTPAIVQAAKDSGKLEMVHVGDKKPANKLQERIAADVEKAGGKIIGKNAEGLDIREDSRGVRSVTRDGVKVEEKVELRPMRASDGGVTYGVARTELVPELMTDTERAEKNPQNVYPGNARKAPAATETVAEKPADYGASNKLVSQSRADELRSKLREKAKSHMFGGLDTEMMAWGTELAVFHLEAGVRKFSDLVAAMARDLETTPAKLKPYLRSWYNGARDMMEDHGLSIEGMDSPETVRAELAKIGTEAAPDSEAKTSAPSLSESLLSAIRAGNMPKDNPALKKLVEAFDGKPADPARMKEAQEQLEAAIVAASREVVAKSEGDKATFDALLRLYESQPNLNVRTSTSIANQAYSTPAPLAFIASQLAGITKQTLTHEPTAGTGMLLIGADPKNSVVNELNDLRVSLLEQQGFTPTQKDAATAPLRDKRGPVDAVITNPPFGSVKDDSGKATKVKVDGYNLGQIDHLIAARALETMKDDGRAVLILGANKAPGGLSTDDRIFFNWLYSHYNVVGHFEVAGDLYARQGAGWPVRVITIAGREKSARISPVAGTIERVDNWSQVYDQYKQLLDSSGRPVRSAGAAAGRPVAGQAQSADVPSAAGPEAAKSDRPGRTERAGGNGNVTGARAGAVADLTGATTDPVGHEPDEQRLNAQSFVPPRLDATGQGAKPVPAKRPAKPAGTAAVADAPAEDSANYEGAAQRRPASAQDKAVMQAIAEGKSARDVLRVVASGSKDPFLRQVARLLLKSGITPNIEFGHIGKTDKGDPIHGQYRGKTDTIAIAGSAEYAAERIFMHEAMHAATMRALAKPGLVRLQLQKLAAHVRKQPGAAGFYGISDKDGNVDEFVAEVFTNTDFQAALRQMKAPSDSGTIKTAWDSFVRILRSILGLKNDPNNVLSQALQLGVAAMRQDMGLRQQGARGDRAANVEGEQIESESFRKWYGDWQNAAKGVIGNGSAHFDERGTPDFDAVQRNRGVGTNSDGATRVGDFTFSGTSGPVGRDGAPARFFHGTRDDITAFDGRAATRKDAGWLGAGFYFTSNTDDASYYSGAKTGAVDRNVMPVYVAVRNPYVASSAEKAEQKSWSRERLRQRSLELQELGYDGIALAAEDGSIELVAFKDTQIKSAIGNNGNFDPEDPDIRNFGMDDATAAAKNIGQGLKAMTATNIKKAGKHKLTDWLALGLQFLGRRQLVDVYGNILPMAEYDRLAAQMEADKNDVGASADDLARRWGKLTDEGKLAELMHDATLAQIDADASVDAVDGDDRAQSAMLKARFKSLSPEAQKVYQEARDSYKEHHAQVRQAIKERIQRSELSSQKRQELLKKMDDDFFQKVKGVYFPLARFGQYVVAVKDADGKVVSVSRAETMPEADAMREEMRKAFPSAQGYNVGRVTLSKDFVANHQMVGRGFVSDLYAALEKMDVPHEQLAELEDTIGQLYLSSLPDLSWAKHGIHRKGTPGFSQDARRAFAQNTFHGARYLAKLRYGDLMQDELDGMQKHVNEWSEVDDFDQPKAQRVVNEMMKRHDALMNPVSNPVSTALTSFGFIYYLGLSPAAAIVNLSQTALVAYPVMAGKWGYKKSAEALMKASAETVAGKNDLRSQLKDADEIAAYDEAVRTGAIDVTQAHDLAGIAQGEDAKVMWKMRPVMRAASFLFHHAERFNRQATFIAAYRLARAAGTKHVDAYEQAVKATYDGHYDYSSGNRPRVMQGNVARVVLLFKQFAQNMIFTLGRQAYQSVAGESPEIRKEARKVFAGLITMHAAAAGVLGLPLVGPLLAVASALGGDDDEPWDAEVALRNMLAETFGNQASEVIAKGFSRLTPWDASGRVGLDKLIFPDVQEGLEGQRWAEQFATGMLGPVVGIGVNAAKAAQKMADGDYGRALEDLLPVAMRNPIKAGRYMMEGAQDRSGIAIKDEVSAAGSLGQLIGFSPSEVRLAFEGRKAIVDAERRLKERRSELLGKFAKAVMSQDQEGVIEARQEIAKFNEKNVGRRITYPQMTQSVRARQRRIDQAEDGVYLPRNRREAMEAGQFAFGS